MKTIDQIFENNLNYVEHGFFTKAECEAAVEEFQNFEQTKSMIRSDFRYYTVGNSFLDHLDTVTRRTFKDRNEETAAIAAEQYLSSPRMYTATHDLLLTKFQKLFGMDVKYCDKLSIPGYSYCMPNDGTNEQPAYLWHYDDEKVFYPYKHEFPDYTDLSYFDDVFTMTIVLTEGEFTYDYFKQTYTNWPRPKDGVCNNHFRLRGDDCPNPECTLKEYSTIHYKAGTLNMGRQCRLHRIGKSVFTHGPRIAMQCHGAMKNNTIYLYW